MYKTKAKKSKYIIIILILSILFFILFNIQNEESKKQEITIEKVNSKIYENQINNNTEEQSTEDAKTVEKEVIETEFKGYKVSSKIYIPKINLETYVLEQYSTQALLTSVTKFYGANPNQIGNFCVAGHNYGPENMFQNLKKLNINDEIYLTDIEGNKMKYIIYETYTVLPNDTKCLSQKTNGKIELTLITCTFDSQKRIIIKARAQNSI